MTNAFDGADIIASHHGRRIQTVGIAFERNSIFSKVALKQIVRCCGKLTDGVDPEARQHFFRRSPDAEHIGGREIPDLVSERLLRNTGDSVRLFHIGTEFRKDLVEAHPCRAPFEGFERSWNDEWKQRYAEVIKRADLVKYVCKGYSRACFQIRNEWMVDRSSRVIAVFDGQPGGTKNTIIYAQKNRVEVRLMGNDTSKAHQTQ